jgi:transposase
MTTSTLYHTQGVHGFKYQKTQRKNKTEYYFVYSTATQVNCPCCKSSNTCIAKTGTTRDIRGVHIGFKKVILRVEIRRIQCSDCGVSAQEPLPFCAGPNRTYSKWLAKYVLSLRKEMSISAIAQLTGLHWTSVKDIEKRYLTKKHKRPSLKTVEYMGIDEVHLGAKLGYITVVRDLDTGAVLFIGKGKGGTALEGFEKRIKRKSKQIKAVTMDMSNAYSAWVDRVLPNADIIYDHFHVVKLMNERMDGLRRSTMNKLNDEQKKELKGKRFVLLRNQEDLSRKAAEELKKLRFEFQDLGTASMMKEYLRNIYRMADCYKIARKAFTLWCDKAEISEIHCLKQMAKTIRKRMEGLLGFWKHHRLTNASQEGFNNKIGWLTRQAFGYTDEEYLHLKIFDLPNLSIRKEL